MFREIVRLMLVMTFVLLAFACAEPRAREDSAPASPVAEAPAPIPPPVPGTAPANPYTARQISRGEALVRFGSCEDCHTPWKFDPAIGAPVPDSIRQLSGHPQGAPDPEGSSGAHDMGLIGPTGTSFALPFGVVHAPNLTPDIDTGIGSWTEEMWVRTFRTASHMGGNGRPILPPMPWYSVASLPDEDLIAVFAYLRSIPPIRNGVATFNPPMPVQDALRRAHEKTLGNLEEQKVKAAAPRARG